MNVGFMDLQKVYNKDNMEELWQVLRIYDVGSKFLNGIKSMNVNSLASVREKMQSVCWFYRFGEGI